MCRGPIAEDTLVEVPPDYESQQQNEAHNDADDQPWYSSSKVALSCHFSDLLSTVNLSARLKTCVNFMCTECITVCIEISVLVLFNTWYIMPQQVFCDRSFAVAELCLWYSFPATLWLMGWCDLKCRYWLMTIFWSHAHGYLKAHLF